MTFTVTTAHKYQISWVVAILATVVLAVYATIYSLTHGIYEVFPFLYFLPIIIFVYQYPGGGSCSLLVSALFFYHWCIITAISIPTSSRCPPRGL